MEGVEGCYYISFSITSVVIQFHDQFMPKLFSADGGKQWLRHSPYSYPLPRSLILGLAEKLIFAVCQVTKTCSLG